MPDVTLLAYVTVFSSLVMALAAAWIISQRVGDRALAADVATLFSDHMVMADEPAGLDVTRAIAA
jgi:hypothetical protein